MKLKTLLFTLCIATFFTSCSDDEQTVNSGITPPTGEEDTTTELTEEEQKLVGLWNLNANGNGHFFVFLPNGKACRDGKTYGEWAYDPDTKILATTINMWQFQITALFDDNFVGYTINTGRAVNASRGTDTDMFKQYLNMVRWINTDSLAKYSDPFESHASSYYSVSSMNYSDLTIDGTTFTAKFSYDYSWDCDRHSGHSSANGSLTVTNAYSDNPSLKIEHKYSKDSDLPMREGTYMGYWK